VVKTRLRTRDRVVAVGPHLTGTARWRTGPKQCHTVDMAKSKKQSAKSHKDHGKSGSGRVGTFNEALPYVLRQAAAALRTALGEDLKPLGLTVPQHACLELLGRSPGLSNSDLARGAFVSRQSMNLVLRGLQERGLVTRPSVATAGRTLPTTLTTEGKERLNSANALARAVEKRMISAVPEKRRARFRDDLAACAEALAVAD
jgi:DNA-binding MarR family transcriptional regulator